MICLLTYSVTIVTVCFVLTRSKFSIHTLHILHVIWPLMELGFSVILQSLCTFIAIRHVCMLVFCSLSSCRHFSSKIDHVMKMNVSPVAVSDVACLRFILCKNLLHTYVFMFTHFIFWHYAYNFIHIFISCKYNWKLFLAQLRFCCIKLS